MFDISVIQLANWDNSCLVSMHALFIHVTTIIIIITDHVTFSQSDHANPVTWLCFKLHTEVCNKLLLHTSKSWSWSASRVINKVLVHGYLCVHVCVCVHMCMCVCVCLSVCLCVANSGRTLTSQVCGQLSSDILQMSVQCPIMFEQFSYQLVD